MQIYRYVATIAVSLALAGQVFPQTSPPPQLQTTNEIAFSQVGWSLNAFWRVANNGNAPTQWRLGMDVSITGTLTATDYLWDFSGTPHFGVGQLLGGNTTAASARCGNYDGYFAGQWYDPGPAVVLPAYWTSSSASPASVADGGNLYPGVFTDMTSNAAGDYFCGHYTDAFGDELPAVWATSFTANSPVILGHSGFADGADAYGMNNNLDVVGAGFGTLETPVMWQYVSGTTWTPIDITDATHLDTAWPSGREGY